MENILLILALILSCGIVLITTPPIVRVARAKNIFDETNDRKLHKSSVPTLGGISLFMAISITTAILTVGHFTAGYQVVYAAMILLFFVGIKDDIIFISPSTKFLIQLLAAFMLVVIGDFSIHNFEGLLGLHKVPPILGQSFTVVLIVLLINAYNLIDGIDGLAGIMGIMASLFFAVWFYINGYFAFAILSTALVGSLLGFLRFNLFSKEYKIFMGDTGSLLVGLLMATQVIWFLNSNLSSGIPYPVAYAPSIVLAIIAIPLIDTLRVFTLRIVKSQSPFNPDNNHIHHRVLSFLPHHLHSSMGITIVNLLIIGLAFILSYTNININLQFLIVLIMTTGITIFPGLMVRSLKSKHGLVKPLIQPPSGLKLDLKNYKVKYNGKAVKFPEPELVEEPQE